MFVATNHLVVREGSGAEVERRFAGRSGVDAQPGFVRFELWRMRKAQGAEEYLVVTYWESEAAQAAWTQSEAFRRAHAGARPDFILASTPRSYDVVLQS